MNFDPLFLSPQWLKEYHTKYPHGLSVLENIIEWVNLTNKLIDYVNVTPDKVKEIIEEMEADGRLETIINQVLFETKADKNDLFNRGVSPLYFGAAGDGVTDDTTSLLLASTFALSAGVPLVGSGTYLLKNTLNLRNIPVEMDNAAFILDHDDIGILLGGNASSQYNPKQSVGRVTRNTDRSLANTEIRILGAKSQHIKVGRCRYIQLYADTSEGVYSTDYSIAYSNFIFDYVETIELTNNLQTTGSETQWINENNFYLKRSKNIIISGTYHHNHNIFNNGTFENECNLDFQKGNSNKILNVRFEGSTQTINFAKGTWNNLIVISWASNQRSPIEVSNGGTTIIDNGTLNNVVRDNRAYTNIYPILTINPTNLLTFRSSNNYDLTQETNLKNVNVEVAGITTFKRNTQRTIFNSDFIPVTMGDYISISATHGVRIYITMYDENKNKIDNTTDPEAGGGSVFTGYLLRSASISQYNDGEFSNNTKSLGSAVVQSNRVKFLKIVLRGGSDTDIFDYLNINLSSTKSKGDYYVQTVNQTPVRSIAPTKGFAYKGYKISNDNGGWFTCIFSLDTKTSSSASIGTSTITVDSAAGVNVGDIIAVEYGAGNAHWTTVSSVSGNIITLTDLLPENIDNNARVIINRWLNS